MSRRRQDESGFALLLIFVLAAGIAIALMMQMPRVAFETARNREEMLIERGEQYKRAIALFYRKTNRLPAKLEDLENTNNVRFLRRRYIDPMTGKDEWRVIHAGPGGMLTDSLVKKAPVAGDPSKPGSGTQSGQNFGLSNPGNSTGSSAPGFGTGTGTATGTADDGAVNSAVLRRPSDRTPVAGAIQTPFDPNNPNAQQSSVPQGQPIYPGQPGYPQPGTQGYTGQPLYPGQPGYPQQQNINPQQQAGYQNNQPLYPGQPGYPQPGTPNYTGQPIYPGQPGYSQQPQQQASQQGQPIYPGQPGYPQPGTAGYTGQPIYPGQPGYPQNNGQQQNYNPMQNVPGVVNPQQAGMMNQPGMPQMPGQPGYNPNGPAGGPGANSAVGMINDLLRNPRNAPPGTGSAFGNNAIQGGIAGFASNFKGPSIKIYKERQKYQEWEFVYDIKDDPYLKQKQMPGGQGLGGAGLGTSGNPGNTGSSFGNNNNPNQGNGLNNGGIGLGNRNQ